MTPAHKDHKLPSTEWYLRYNLKNMTPVHQSNSSPLPLPLPITFTKIPTCHRCNYKQLLDEVFVISRIIIKKKSNNCFGTSVGGTNNLFLSPKNIQISGT